MSVDNLDHFDLSSVDLNGEINEEVLQQLIRIDEWQNPLLSRIGSGGVGNASYEWLMRKHNTPLLDNQIVDGADAGPDESKTGIRVTNHSQILTKILRVSTRAIEANTIARANELALQIQERGTELLRDKEAQFLSNNGSIAGTDTVAGVTAGLGAWLVSEDIDGNATGHIESVASAGGSLDGGWPNKTGNTIEGRDYTTAPPTPGAMTETAFKNVSQAIYESGGDATIIMSEPATHRTLGEFFFDDGARIGNLESKIAQEARGGAVAQGRVNIWVSDFSVYTMVANRNQQVADAGTGSSTAYLLDPGKLANVDLHGMRVANLAKTGLADNRQLEWDGGLRVDTWEAHGAVVDIDNSLPMVP